MTGLYADTRLPIPVGKVGAVRPNDRQTAKLFARQTSRVTKGLVGGGSARRGEVGLEGRSTRFDEIIREAAGKAGVDEHLVKAVVEAESCFNPRAISPAGAKGLMQLIDSTAKSLGVKDPFDPASNVRGGVELLKSMIDRFGSVPLALAAYNAGPGAVERYGGIPPFSETKAYVDKVIRLQQKNAVGEVVSRERGGKVGDHIG